MEFEKQYCLVSEKDKIENKDKKPIADEAYAMCELLSQIRKQLFRSARHG